MDLQEFKQRLEAQGATYEQWERNNQAARQVNPAKYDFRQLVNAFVWADTYEGHVFWSNVKEENGKNPPLEPDLRDYFWHCTTQKEAETVARALAAKLGANLGQLTNVKDNPYIYYAGGTNAVHNWESVCLRKIGTLDMLGLEEMTPANHVFKALSKDSPRVKLIKKINQELHDQHLTVELPEGYTLECGTTTVAGKDSEDFESFPGACDCGANSWNADNPHNPMPHVSGCPAGGK